MSNTIPIGPVREVERVSVHCMKRVAERVLPRHKYEKAPTVGELLTKLERMVESSHPASLKREVKVKKILSHGARIARYRVYLNGRPRTSYREIPEDAWILVFHDDGTLATVHQNQSGEWEFKDDANDS